LVRLSLGPDYEIFEASDGEEAVALAERECPDVVFMDVRMPRVSGFEGCRRIKANPTTETAKVVIFSARGRDEDFSQGTEVGADDYITKPCSPLALLRKVEDLLGR